MDSAANLAGRLDDVRDQHAPTARDIVSIGHEASLASLAPGGGRLIPPLPPARSTEGVRDQTGPDPDAREMAHGRHDIRGRVSTGWDGALASASVKAW
jgi:hypothetical protein